MSNNKNDKMPSKKPWDESDPSKVGGPRRKKGRAAARAGITPPNARAGSVWVAPSATLSSRRVIYKSKSSFRGALVNPKTNREIMYESTLERDAAYILIAHPDVEDFHEQAAPVRYTDAIGKGRTHTFDFQVRMVNGSTQSLAIKHDHQVVKSGILETLDLIRIQRPKGCGDVIELKTERQITRERAHNARLIVRALNCRIDQDVELMRAFVMTLAGPTRIADILRETIPDARGFMALLCLVADGDIVTSQQGFITYESFVQPRRRAQSSEGV